MNGTVSIPHAGGSPKNIATMSGTQPYTPAAHSDPQSLGRDELLGVHRERPGWRHMYVESCI